jgi:D-galactarolactone cycloisomerase
LLGGAFRQRQPCYASLQNASEAADIEADAVAQATHAAALGFVHVKMKVGWHPPEVDARWVNEVLAALPAGIDLAIDANRVLDIASAERLIRGIRDPDRIAWFEEPLSNRFPLAYRELRARCPVPIAGGESMPLAMLRDVIAGRMMDIVQPDLVGHGGFGPMLHMLELCDAHGVRLIPHCFDGQVMRLATLHLLASRPDWEEKHGGYGAAPLEVDISPNPLRDELLGGPLRPDAEGLMPVPAGPGLGLTVNADFVARHGTVIAD